MEKKTIGTFIAALRKANGLTQKQLADKLYVSDKTVSRWEHDECAPDLSLIPLIADTFGVTADELLRGERTTTTSSPDLEERTEKDKEKAEKRFAVLLNKRLIKYKNLSMLPIGLSVLGLLVAVIANAFNEGLLGFWLGLAFEIAAVILQICFINTFLLREEESEEKTDGFNRKLYLFGKNVFFLIVGAIGAILPLLDCPYSGYALSAEAWFPLALTFAPIAVLVAALVFEIFLYKKLPGKGISEEKRKELLKFMKKCGICTFVTAILAFTGIATVETLPDTTFAKAKKFETWEDFQAYMALSYDSDDYSLSFFENLFVNVEISISTSITPSDEIDEKIDEDFSYPQKAVLKDENGNVLCEYVDNNKSVSIIHPTYKNEDGLPVVTYTYTSLQRAYAIEDFITRASVFLLIADLCGVTFLYFRKKRKL